MVCQARVLAFRPISAPAYMGVGVVAARRRVAGSLQGGRPEGSPRTWDWGEKKTRMSFFCLRGSARGAGRLLVQPKKVQAWNVDQLRLQQKMILVPVDNRRLRDGHEALRV
jgi:hypothetical protein